MTVDSTAEHSECKTEWSWALRYKKPVVPIKLHADAELPFRLSSQEYVDCTQSFEAGLATIRERLRWLGSPEGQLQTLEHRLADANRALRRAHAPETPRIRREI